MLKTPIAEHHVETEEKNSRFLAELRPVSNVTDIKARQRDLKAQHPKANHVCYAFRLMNNDRQIIEGFSDDGEPGGTSGPPMLKVMQHHHLINCAILITRYFGGIKLGTGGLQRAYGGAASSVICDLPMSAYSEWKATEQLILSCGFAEEAAVRRLLTQVGAMIDEEQYTENGPDLTITMTEEASESLSASPLARIISLRPTSGSA